MTLLGLLVQLTIAFAILVLVVSLFFPGDLGRRIRAFALGLAGAWLLFAISVHMVMSAFRSAPFSSTLLLIIMAVVAYFVLEGRRRANASPGQSQMPRVGGKKRVRRDAADLRETLRSVLSDDDQ
jgi:hypothetical protein